MRLGSSPKIAATLKLGRRYPSKSLVLHVLRVPSQDVKFAFSVSKKVGNSVVRHKITRQLRQIVAQNLALVPVGSQIVVRALPQVTDQSYSQLTAEYLAIIKKIADQ